MWRAALRRKMRGYMLLRLPKTAASKGRRWTAGSERLRGGIEVLVHRVTCCTRTGPLPLLPSGPGGVGGIASRRTRHTC